MIYLILAILLLILAHIFKTYRLKQFIELYEEPNQSRIIESLSLSYIINFFIPYKLGDIFRAWFMGRKMKNGLSFSLALVIIDRILDVIMVGIIFIILYFVGIRAPEIYSSICFYVVLSVSFIIIIFLAYKLNYFVKITVKKIANIFNEEIELKILKFSWFLITSFKDMLDKINKRKLIIYTLIMWTLYLSSYYFFALAAQSFFYNTNFTEVFISLFSNSSLDLSTTSVSLNNHLMLIYMFIPLIILIIISKIYPHFKKNKKSNNSYLELLPQANIKERLVFLEGYFSSKSSEYYNNYIDLNRDISILQDFSAGSNATTMLCTHNNKMFFRKYSFGKDSFKLHEQVKWLQNHESDIPLTKIQNVKWKEKGEYCAYDMPYKKEAISCFNYVHSMPIKEAWSTLKKVLDSLEELYDKNRIDSNKKSTEKYIFEKVEKNIEKIENGKYIKPLLKYDTLIINGQKYKNLRYFKSILNSEYLYNLFKNETYADIHGDLTIENIICLNNKKNNNFYIIDPNTGNIHNSPNLDYGKLLQSLHGGYEFLMNTKNIEVNNNNINFLSTKSKVYDDLYKKYDDYLNTKFSKITVKNIYYHEIIHWLRLMPYKIEKNGERSVIFYAQLIIILNYVKERFGE